MSVEGVSVVLQAVGPRRWRRILAKVLEDAAMEIVDKARKYAPKKTGRLMRSIQKHRVGGFGYKVSAGAPYAAYMEFGTRAHIIVPRRARALHFFTKTGEEVFTTRVHHPGTKPFAYMRRAVEEVMRRLSALVMRNVRD